MTTSLLALCPGFSLADQCVDAPSSGPVKHHKEKHPAIKYGELALIGKQRSGAGDREELRHRRSSIPHVYHEIRDGHFAAADESADARKQTKGNEKSTNELDPAAGLSERIVRTRHATKHAENQLPTVRRKHESSD